MEQPIPVLLADDHAVVRKGIKEFLEEDGQITVVAEAANGTDALRLAGERRPAVAVLDIQMPGMTGIEVTRQIKAAYPDVRVLILTAYDDDPYVFALLRAGADGYVLKNADSTDLVRAVKSVAAGGRVLDPAITGKVVAQMTSGRTVQGHLATIYGKLGVNSRTEAVTRALKLGWIVLES
jgi:DNA-binding NarL/FixJ family response regulator